MISLFKKFKDSHPSEQKWDPVVWRDWEPLIPPRDLWVAPEIPMIHFFRWLWEYRAYLTLLCGMRDDSSVLELGCNHGRTMLGLLDYLRPPGRYEGLDIMEKQIEFAQAYIHDRFHHVNFTHVDVHNSIYNPRGQLRADTFTFPYPDRSFDIVYAASLFTHLLPPATVNYFKEIRRVLRPEGRCLLRFFILDNYRGKGTSGWQGYEFDYPLSDFEGVALHNPTIPEQLVAYTIASIEKLATEARLLTKSTIAGYWSKTHHVNVNEQDLIVFEAV